LTNIWKYVGGFIGNNQEGGDLSNCYSKADVEGNGDYTGGLVGSNEAKISKCSSKGSVTGGGRFVGGLLGQNKNNIKNCNSDGNVTGNGAFSGGLIGLNQAGKISDCFSLGNVSGGFDTGGLVGENRGSISNSFYSINDTMINGVNLVSPYGIYNNQFQDWMIDKKINIYDYFHNVPLTDFLEVRTIDDLQNMLPFFSGNYKFKQVNDIDLSPVKNFYIPIFSSNEYDGSGYKITSMNLDLKTSKYLGLFGITDSDTRVSNITIENSSVIGNDYLGSLVGKNYGNIENCNVQSFIDGKQYVGGIIGYNEGDLSKLSSQSIINGSNYVGGLVGGNIDCDIINSSSAGNVTGEMMIGGFIGKNDGIDYRIRSSTSNCTITSKEISYGYAGGFIGHSSGYNILDSYCEGILKGRATYSGGFIGYSVDNEISRCYSRTYLNTIGQYGGGLIGYLNSDISQCYSACEMKALGPNIGGLIGKRSYYGSVSNSFWDDEISNKSTSDGGIGKNTTEMKTNSTFSGAGWNLTSHWFITENVTYPYLRNQNYFSFEDYTVKKVEVNSTLEFNVSVIGKSTIVKNEIEYWNGSGSRQKSVMLKGNTYTFEINADYHPDSPIYFRYIATDEIGMIGQSQVMEVKILDLNNPIFNEDKSQDIAYTGDIFRFNISVSDDIEVGGVYVEYWFGNKTHMNRTMERNLSNFNYQLLVPENSLEDLHYIFYAVDSSENWNQTESQNVTVYDNDPPSFVIDLSLNSATTGEKIEMVISVNDNIELSNVSLEYWFGSDEHTNISLNGKEYFTYSVSIPWNSTKDLHYFFLACDTSGNWNQTEQKNVTILDNDKPRFGKDTTPTSGTTEDIHIFNISTTDNIDIGNVYVEYWFGTGPHTNVSMSGTGPYTYQIKIPSNSTATLHYIFHAVDDSGNWNQTAQKNVTVVDNDSPVFGNDTTPINGTTGESILFSIEVDDNIGVDEVYLEYWQGRKAPVNISMNFSTGFYQYSVNVPIDYDEDFHYIFRAVDEAGNWVETSQKDIRITDNDRPELLKDVSSTTGTTGDPYSFQIDSTDNIGVDGVFVEYWFGTGPHSNVSMLETSGTYSHSITIPYDSLDILHYIFHAVDDAGNWAETDQRNVSIRDNDDPVFGEDLTSDSGSTGDPFLFEVEVEDNIEIEGVWVSYWFGTEDAQDIQLTFGSGIYSVEVIIPWNVIDDLQYFFYADDTSDNTNETDVKDVSILDNDRAVFGLDSSVSIATTGDEFR
jgi:hypothetical protein